MKLIKYLIIFLVVGVFYFVPGLARASYITFPAAVGVMDEVYNDCEYYSLDGTVIGGSGGCYLFFPIPISSGQTLSSVTVYYYDNSGSQSMYVYLDRLTLSSDNYSLLTYGSDTSTSASVQSKTLSYGSATSSSYAYNIRIYLDDDTELRGVKIYYY